MIMLGVDPGFSVTGFGIMKKEGGKTFILDYGALRMSSKDSLSRRTALFHDFFTSKITEWKIEAIALETPFLGKNAQSFLKLGYLRGILYLLADRFNLPLIEVSPRSVKLAVTGSGSAPKEQVARVIGHLFRDLTVPKTLDITDALAVTLCGIWHSNKATLPVGYLGH
ncbi:crossover junction endodeoxyribonuclease RuvC [Candidatus Dependentiae bacterium]|nr:crossover junction endodeoxyribonuclease RuvC [Candidatus Dependentiae bacterium]